ncbi:MAG TPA: hypothetical protein VHL57_05085 [Flavobacteriales bacterium]|jgi:hypothetical protein|nr:hypothetical protein [Flavobacteriales bacterium]
MTREDYAKQFATASVRRLIETIDRPDENDPLAVEMASAELDRRQVPQEEVAAVRAELHAAAQRVATRKANVKEAGRRVSDAVTEARDTFIVHSDTAKQDRRQVRILLVVLAVMWSAVIPRYADLFRMRWIGMDASVVEHILPLILLPLALFLVWKRKRAGWFLGAGIALYALLQLLSRAWLYWNYEPSEFAFFDALLAIPSRQELALGTLFAFGLALAFQLRRSLSIFQITERERWITIAAVAAGVWGLWST